MNRLPEDITLFQLVSLLPGICDLQQSINQNDNTYTLYFNVKDTDEGLFILTRCTDRRYFHFADKCNIQLAVGDTMNYENNRPITYILSMTYIRPLPGKYTADVVANELVANILHHLNQNNFKEYFKIDSDSIYNKYLSLERKKKIETIKLRKLLEQTKDLSFLVNNTKL